MNNTGEGADADEARDIKERDGKRSKRYRSSEQSHRPKQSKKKKLTRQSKDVTEESSEDKDDLKLLLPEETPEWGNKLVEIMLNQFKSIKKVDSSTKDNAETIKRMEKKTCPIRIAKC